MNLSIDVAACVGKESNVFPRNNVQSRVDGNHRLFCVLERPPTPGILSSSATLKGPRVVVVSGPRSVSFSIITRLVVVVKTL
jgi:hypothetical protein